MNALFFGWKEILGCLFVAAMLFACSSTADHTATSADGVGLWRQKGPAIYAITLRRADGTYRQKGIQIYDYAKPSIEYETAGHWRVTGRKYTYRLDQVSSPLWNKYVGTERTLEVLRMTNDLFEHLSSDGGIVEERKIGPASEAQFEKVPLRNPR